MPSTRSFKDTVKARVESDAAFREALLSEAEAAIRSGDTGMAKVVLRDYVNASTDT